MISWRKSLPNLSLSMTKWISNLNRVFRLISLWTQLFQVLDKFKNKNTIVSMLAMMNQILNLIKETVEQILTSAVKRSSFNKTICKDSISRMPNMVGYIRL